MVEVYSLADKHPSVAQLLESRAYLLNISVYKKFQRKTSSNIIFHTKIKYFVYQPYGLTNSINMLTYIFLLLP